MASLQKNERNAPTQERPAEAGHDQTLTSGRGAQVVWFRDSRARKFLGRGAPVQRQHCKHWTRQDSYAYTARCASHPAPHYLRVCFRGAQPHRVEHLVSFVLRVPPMPNPPYLPKLGPKLNNFVGNGPFVVIFFENES